MANIKAIMWDRTKHNHSKYQWPADKLTATEMTVLYNWRKLTGTPINYLLQEAIQQLNKIIQDKRPEVK